MSIASTPFHTQIVSTEDKDERLVVVRYYLDRPGYDLQHSSARLWRSAPSKCGAQDIILFLQDQGIVDDASLVVELYLDKFQSYMLLEAADSHVSLDFSTTSVSNPGILNLRLTDTSPIIAGGEGGSNGPTIVPSNHCNTSPVGIFAFSMTVGLEAAHLTGKLVEGSIEPAFDLRWGPYAFFVSGLLQLIVGILEVSRNNVYGATAFMAFGSFWLANGTYTIFTTYFPAEIPDEFKTEDDWGNFVRNFYIFGFACVLFKQTLAMNKLSSLLICLLIVFTFASCITSWSEAFQWIQMVVAWGLSAFAFYVFTAEFTNEVYQRSVFDLYPWKDDAVDETFGAAGRGNRLQSRATRLRTAHHQRNQNFHNVRTAKPSERAVLAGE